MSRFRQKHPRLAALFALVALLGTFELLVVLCMNQGPPAPKQSVHPLPVTLGDCVELGTVENGRLVGFSPNGNTLAVVGDGGWTSAGPIRLWDVRSGKEKASVGEGWDQIQMVHFSPDSTMIAVSDKSNGIGVWDIATGNQRDAFKPRTFFGNCVSFWFSPDSKSLIYKHFAENFPHDRHDQLFNVRDIGAEKDRATIVGESWLFEFSPDGTRIATATSAARGVKRRVMLWAWVGGQPPVLLREHSVRADSIAFSHSLNSFATANTTGQPRDTTEIQIVDMNTGRARLTFTHTDEETHIQDISFSRDGKLLIANGGGGHQLAWTTRSTVWDVSGRAARTLGSYPVEPGVSSSAGSLAVQSLTGRSEVRVSLVEIATGLEKGVLTQPGDVTGSFYGGYNNLKSYASTTFSPDGRLVIAWRVITNQKSGGYRVARIWQVEPLKELETLHSCRDLSFSPNGRSLIVLEGDGTLKLWRLSRCHGQPHHPYCQTSRRQAMRKWSLGLIGVSVPLALLCVYLARPYPPRPPGPGVTWDNAERIQPGMTSEQAEGIVGHPPQSETSAAAWDETPPDSHKVMMWSDTDCDILVYLDKNRRVLLARTVPERPQHSWHQRLRHRLGL